MIGSIHGCLFRDRTATNLGEDTRSLYHNRERLLSSVRSNVRVWALDTVFSIIMVVRLKYESSSNVKPAPENFRLHRRYNKDYEPHSARCTPFMVTESTAGGKIIQPRPNSITKIIRSLQRLSLLRT